MGAAAQTVVLAHAGGAVESVAIVVPLFLVGLFVVKERQNVRRLREAEAQDGPAGTSQADEPG